MSLAEAVATIAEQMEYEKQAFKEDYPYLGQAVSYCLQSYARQLRAALKACEGEILPGQRTSEGPYPLRWTDKEAEWKAKARAEFAGKREKLEEEASAQLQLIIDGPLAGDYCPISLEMPIGARTWVGQEVYQLCANGLRHCPPISKKDEGEVGKNIWKDDPDLLKDPDSWGK